MNLYKINMEYKSDVNKEEIIGLVKQYGGFNIELDSKESPLEPDILKFETNEYDSIKDIDTKLSQLYENNTIFYYKMNVAEYQKTNDFSFMKGYD
ncbi:hypothetical protein Metev_1926 [Methanohalobium evestigatum Z-7303]|uniref:Uncharacterized protein n=1 Tax=Methanohalobium evestigatum (strain ATCC BAA-1072 / DSM 3721 / NBRC 107634 / OCM 161 / Z-7303) TaxID=644295 RepID=D7EA85_METEZ|nr:hypothetical protein [Methanohalobium evestigatum]ADI74756.1 hypothetical protein Metev_1926 [Methanohalobium evestigatum Z-7303]